MLVYLMFKVFMVLLPMPMIIMVIPMTVMIITKSTPIGRMRKNFGRGWRTD